MSYLVKTKKMNENLTDIQKKVNLLASDKSKFIVADKTTSTL